jgi:hypothetical protein
MTSPSVAPVPPASDVGAVTAPRDPDLVLARVHLLLGSLSLARTELETLAGRGLLDDDAIRDLAEARWRTGDLAGAGEAAAAWLESRPDDILGLVIAAEAQAALGRPGEARRLAGRAMERANGSLDPVFAGMQRSPIWPVEPGAAVGPVGVLFDDLHPGPHALAPIPAWAGGGDRDAVGEAPGSRPGEPFEPCLPAAIAAGPSLWGDDPGGAVAAAEDDLDPTALFHGARLALEAGAQAEAATGLILALRASPGLAPAVLDLLAGRGEPILALVRGDAQRIVGRELEAVRDHAAAAGGLAVVDDPGPHGESDRGHGIVATAASGEPDGAGDEPASDDDQHPEQQPHPNPDLQPPSPDQEAT